MPQNSQKNDSQPGFKVSVMMGFDRPEEDKKGLETKLSA